MLILGAPMAMAQQITPGVAGGLRLTGDDGFYGWPVPSNSRRYLVGPQVEVGLPLHLAVAVDALYSRLGRTEYLPFIANEYDLRAIADAWTFPVLLRYRLPPRLNTFAEFGIAPRHLSGTTHTIHYGYLPSDVTFSSETWSANDHAWVLGGGIALHPGRLRIAPEFRYLRWSFPANPPDAAVFYDGAPQNEVQILLGIGWAVRE